MFRSRTGAAWLSVLSNSLLIILKLGVGLAMGSVSVISEAIHSGVDLLAAAIAAVSLRIADKPADAEHPYGHGKAENISASLEAALIFVAAAFIIYQAALRLREGVRLEALDLGIGVMAASVVVNLFVSRHLLRIAQETDSLALEADARHLTTDIFTSLGVLLGLVAVRLTGWTLLDPLIALGVALLILRAAYQLLKKSALGLVDIRLPAEEEKIIKASLLEHYGELLGFHDLRTRKAGRERHIDLHLVVAKGASVEKAHQLCDHLERDILARLPHSRVIIHIEPCDMDCQGCPTTCPQAQPAPEKPPGP